MPDETRPVGPSEIDELLKAAQAASGAAPATATAPPASSSQVDPNKISSLLDEAQQALSALDEPAALPAGVKPFEFKDLAGTTPANDAASLDLLRDVQLDLKI